MSLAPGPVLAGGIGAVLAGIPPLQAAAEPPELTTGMLVVFGIVLAALVLFVWDPFQSTSPPSGCSSRWSRSGTGRN